VPAPFDVIAFDADDTLWHNERSFQQGRERFGRILATAGIDIGDAAVDAHVNATELRNLEYYGYGVSSFVLSLIESAIHLTDGRIASSELGRLIELAKHMLTEEVDVFDSGREAVSILSATHTLMLVTKGDLLHQTAKLERSGLQPFFRYVEVVSRKTPPVYAAILERLGIAANDFLMVGNSMRSDILPVVDLGGWAIYVPAALSWEHEDAEPAAELGSRFSQIETLADLPRRVRELEAGRN
jgi:putative hydrolase of the HAD superfamily